MSTRRGTSTQVATSIPFNDTTNTYDTKNVGSVLNELRTKTIYRIEEITSTLNGSYNVTDNDHYLHLVTGSATGFSVQLPDATTLNYVGRRFEVFNDSSKTITLKDGSGGVLASLISGDVVVATLENNGTVAGSWLLIVNSSSATGIFSYSIGSQTLFSTTSTIDVLIPGMEVIPVAGRYGLWYSSDIQITNNNRAAQAVIYQDTLALERTRRTVQGVGSNFKSSLITIAEISVNGSETISVRVNIDSGSLDVNSRRLLLIRLGS